MKASERLMDAVAALDVKVSKLLDIVEDRRTRREWYSTNEAAAMLGKRPYTVREWARLGRIHAEKRRVGRGATLDWAISHEELDRIRNEGLLPLPRRAVV